MYDSSMLDSVIRLMASTGIEYSNGGGRPVLTGNDRSNAGYCCYEIKDGLQMIGFYNTGQHARPLRALGRPEMGGNLKGLTDIDAAHDSYAQTLKEIPKTKGVEECAEAMCAAGPPAARVLRLKDGMAQEQHNYRCLLHTLKLSGIDNDSTVPVESSTYKQGGPSVRSAPPTVS